MEGHSFDQCDTLTYTATGAVAAGNAMTVSVTPSGELWEILYLDVYHNDAAGPQGCFYLSKAATKIQIGAYAALASAVRRYLYDGNAWPAPLKISPQNTLSYEVPAGATNGSAITLSMVYRPVRGVQ